MFGHMVSWVGGKLQFSNLHRSGTRFPWESCCVFGPQKCASFILRGGKRSMGQNNFVVGEKTPALFLKCIKKTLGNERTLCVLNISRYARRTHAFFLKNVKKPTPQKRNVSYGDRFL